MREKKRQSVGENTAALEIATAAQAPTFMGRAQGAGLVAVGLAKVLGARHGP